MKENHFKFDFSTIKSPMNVLDYKWYLNVSVIVFMAPEITVTYKMQMKVGFVWMSVLCKKDAPISRGTNY